MEPAGLELVTGKTEAPAQYVGHEANFLLGSVVRGSAECGILVGFQCPCAHAEAELDVRFDLAGMKSTVEEAELDSALSEHSMEIEAVIAGGVVVVMVDASAVTAVCGAVPELFDAPSRETVLFGFHGVEEIPVGLLAPSVLTNPDLKRLIEKVLPSDEEACQSPKARGCVTAGSDVNVDPAGAVCLCSVIAERSDDFLYQFDVLISADRGNEFAGALTLVGDRSIGFAFPLAPVLVDDIVIIVGVPASGADRPVSLFSENPCYDLLCVQSADAVHLDLDAECLCLNAFVLHGDCPFLVPGVR